MVPKGGKTFRLKLLIDKNVKKVLFAEAEKDFVDFFHIMTLPVGTVVRLLKNNGMVGSIGNLYWSIESIGDVYMVSVANKEALLKPISPWGGPRFPLQLPDSSSASASKTYYKCQASNCNCMADRSDTKCPSHGARMKQWFKILVAEPSNIIHSSGCVKEIVMYMVMDDLEVKPLSTISSMATLRRFRVKDVEAQREGDGRRHK